MVAALVGWFVCALFASVAFNWTFYYLLALAAARARCSSIGWPRDVAAKPPGGRALQEVRA